MSCDPTDPRQYVESVGGGSFLRYPAGILDACMAGTSLAQQYPCVAQADDQYNSRFREVTQGFRVFPCNDSFCTKEIPRDSCDQKGIGATPEQCQGDCCEVMFRGGWVMDRGLTCQQVLCVPPTPGMNNRDPLFSTQYGCYDSLEACNEAR